MKKIIFFLFIFSTITANLLGNNEDKVEFNYKIRRISPDGGLGTNGQRDVRQDKWGFIWIITVNDLYRFDGYVFKHYTDKLKRPTTSSGWSFERIEIDKNGNVYITSNFGLLRYNPLKDDFNILFKGSVSLISEDTKGRLWISSSSTAGLFDTNKLDFTPVESEEGAINGVSAIYAKGEYIFIGTNSGEIYQYEEEKGKFKHVFNKNEHNIVDISYRDSLLYMLTEKQGLTVISLNDYKEVRQYDFFYPKKDRRASARAVLIDKIGHIWISTQRGIYILDSQTDKYTRYYYDKTDTHGMPSSSVWRISEDNQGNLWFGTYSGGLCFISLNEQKKIKSFNGLTDELSYPVVSSFEEDENYLWIGTEGGGLNRYEKKTGKFIFFKHNPGRNSLSYDNIQSLLLTGENDLWIGTSRGGLDMMNTKTGYFSHYSVSNNSLLNDHVERIVAESDSGIWIKYLMNRNQLTYISLKGNKPKHFNFLASPIQSNGNISDIQRGNGDTLWVASIYQLLIMNVNTKEVVFAPYKDFRKNNHPDIYILSIFADNKNHKLWIGTNGNGLLVYDIPNQSITKAADMSKYNVQFIYSINQDNNGNIWMGTNNGLFFLDTQTKRIQQYGKNDGAQGLIYYPHSTFKSSTGELYFGGNEGFTVISPTENSFNEYKPDIILVDFLLDNTVVIPGMENSPLKASIIQTRELTLKYNQNNFSFNYTSTNYLNPDKNRFRYRLKGYNDQWIETDANHRVAAYAKVPSGKYTFEIMTANNDGVWGELKVVKLIIKPAPWLSIWAIVGYIILLTGIIFYLIRHYNNLRKQKLQSYLDELEKKQKEECHQAQLSFFTNVSHDFRTPLSLILAATEVLKSEGRTGKSLTVLENNAKRLLSLVNELMDFRSLQNEKIALFLQKNDWNRFVEKNCSDFSEYAKQRNFSFSVKYDPTLPEDLYFDVKVIEKIILNLLNNAFKYTAEGGNIEITTLANPFRFESAYSNHIIIKANENINEMFGLVISDSGIGISGASIGLVFERYYRINESSGNQHLGSGVGLALVKSLVELHQGYIAVYSERGKGSDFIIGFPTDISVYTDEDFIEDNNKNYLSDAKIYHIDEENGDKKSIEYSGKNGRRGLIVEDNDDLRVFLLDMLDENYKIKGVSNGVEALELLKKENIDFIITDIMMPEMSGTELCKTIKENFETSHIPIVILTAKSGLENRIEGLHSGADIYLEKPVTRQVLLLTLSNLFKQQERIKEYYAKHYFAQTNNVEALCNKRDSKFMKDLIELTERHLSNSNIDVQQIATSLAMSRRTLYSKVKALTGQSVVEFIRNYRLRKSAQILAEENINILEVMDRVGIDNASYFSRIFKQEFGESPSDFAARHHLNEEKQTAKFKKRQDIS